MAEPKATATTYEQALALGFAGEAIYPSPKAGRGTIKGVTVNSNDNPTPYQVSGPGADTDVSEDDKKGS